MWVSHVNIICEYHMWTSYGCNMIDYRSTRTCILEMYCYDYWYMYIKNKWCKNKHSWKNKNLFLLIRLLFLVFARVFIIISLLRLLFLHLLFLSLFLVFLLFLFFFLTVTDLGFLLCEHHVWTSRVNITCEHHMWTSPSLTLGSSSSSCSSSLTSSDDDVSKEMMCVSFTWFSFVRCFFTSLTFSLWRAHWYAGRTSVAWRKYFAYFTYRWKSFLWRYQISLSKLSMFMKGTLPRHRRTPTAKAQACHSHVNSVRECSHVCYRSESE